MLGSVVMNGTRRMSGVGGSNGLQNIQASSISSSTSHLNYHNPFSSTVKKPRGNQMRNQSFQDLGSRSMMSGNGAMNRRAGSNMFGNSRGLRNQSLRHNASIGGNVMFGMTSILRYRQIIWGLWELISCLCG